MNRSRITAGVVVLVGIVLFAATVPAGTAGGGPPPRMDEGNASVTRSPGAQLAAGVATEGALLENEHRRRTLNVTLARARTPDAQASVIAETETALDRQLDALEARSARLADARRTGRIERERYRAESTTLATTANGIERRIERLRDATTGIAEDTLEAYGVSGDSIERLAERARAVGPDDDDDDVEDD